MRTSNWVDLFVLRHGIAQERSLEIDDGIRSLTNQGRIKATRVIQRLKGLGIKADRIFTSPYKRALETAEIAFQEGLGYELEISEDLEPLGDPFALLERLSSKSLFIGHEPNLSMLITKLIQSGESSISLKKAGFAHLRWSKDIVNPIGKTQLICLLKPSSLK